MCKCVDFMWLFCEKLTSCCVDTAPSIDKFKLALAAYFQFNRNELVLTLKQGRSEGDPIVQDEWY